MTDEIQEQLRSQVVDEAEAALMNAAASLKLMQEYEQSRELSLAFTKAEEMNMWFGYHQGKQGRYVSNGMDDDDEEVHAGQLSWDTRCASVGMPPND